MAGLDLSWPFVWLCGACFGMEGGCDLFVTGGPLMLLTRVGFRDKKGRFLSADSLKMESMKTDSKVKDGPRKDSRERSGSSKLLQGRLSDLGRGLLVLGGTCKGLLLEWYSLDVGWERSPAFLEAEAGAPSTDTGCLLSLESMSWILVRRVEPSAVEMTLLALGSVEDAESRRSDTEVAFPCEDRLGRSGTEPRTRVLSAFRRVGRPACPADLGGRSELEAVAFPLEERNMPRVFVVVRSFWTCSDEVERRGESTVRFSWLPDCRKGNKPFQWAALLTDHMKRREARHCSPLRDQCPRPGTAAGTALRHRGSGWGCSRWRLARATCAAAGGSGGRSARTAGRGYCRCWTTPPGLSSGWTRRCSHSAACSACRSASLFKEFSVVSRKKELLFAAQGRTWIHKALLYY